MSGEKNSKNYFLLAFCATFLLWAQASFASPSDLKADSSDDLPPIYVEQTITLKKNQTLVDTLQHYELPFKLVNSALYPLQKKYRVTKLRPGQKIKVTYKEDDKNTVDYIEEIELITPEDKIVSSKWDLKKERYTAQVKARPIQIQKNVALGTIEGSLYMSAKKAGMPAALVAPFANLFAWDIDFTRDIRTGDTYKVFYEAIYDDEGQFLRSGRILGAELHTRHKTYDSFRIQHNGIVGYYNSQGINKEKVLLRTPIEFARISSHFNLRRKHPVLGYTRAHKGTDFAAPSGTAIRASGDGVVERASWYGSFGRFISIRHSNNFKTHYAHLSRYGKGIKAGRKVRQGQVIGYVGTSGRSTGPHLHYEVLKRGKHVNPMKVALPVGKKLPSSRKADLNKLVAEAHSQWQQAETLLAQK